MTFFSFFILWFPVGQTIGSQKAEKMRKESLLVFGIVFLLMVSIAYAGVLSYYGKIEGIANVIPPTFYAHSEPEGDYYSYKANLPADGPVKEFTVSYSPAESGVYEFQINGTGYLIPEVSSFYISNWTFYYRVKVENVNEARIFVNIFKKTDGGEEVLVSHCGYLNYIIPDGYQTLSGSCVFPGTILSDGERILVKYYAEANITAGETAKVYFKVDDPDWGEHEGTRIEVSV